MIDVWNGPFSLRLFKSYRETTATQLMRLTLRTLHCTGIRPHSMWVGLTHLKHVLATVSGRALRRARRFGRSLFLSRDNYRWHSLETELLSAPQGHRQHVSDTKCGQVEFTPRP